MSLANDIQRSLMVFLRTNRNEIVLPNFFVGTWEMDVMRITDSDYLQEFEIKISRSDFFADFKKSRSKGYGDKRQDVLKHTLIQTGEHAANRFFFVVPKGLISISECPKYAGLIEYSGGWCTQVKNAPMLHKRPFTNYREIARTIAFREREWRYRLNKVKSEYNSKSNKIAI